MFKFPCPLRDAALLEPEKTAITGKKPFTYKMLDDYTEQVKEMLTPYPKGSCFALFPEDPAFTIALLFAAARLSHQVFLVNPDIPSNETGGRLNDLNVVHLFLESPMYIARERTLKKVWVDLQKPFTYLLTSGSLSKPKVCAHSLANHYYSALGSNLFLNYTKEDTWMLSLPLYHVAGLSILFRSILAKATIHAPIEQTNEEFKKANFLSFVPTQLQRLINLPALPQMKCILLGGTILSPSLIKLAWEKGLPLRPTYGSTEMGSQIATYCLKSKKMEVLPYRELKSDVGGEIYVRGKTRFLGYVENNSLSSPFDREGWFSTRDLGSYENATFTYRGRLDNMFISGGENIQPEEIESYLVKHPDIYEAIVYPVPDLEFGHRPHALIKSNKKIDKEILDQFLQDHLPKFKWPLSYKKLEYSGIKPNRAEIAKSFSSL